MRLAYLFLTACALSAAVATAGPTDLPPQPDTSQPKAELPTAEELVKIGANLSDLKRYDEAINAFTLALKMDPKNGIALGDRALAYAWTNRLDDASRDLAAAELIIGDNALIDRGRALIALRKSDDNTALVELTKSLAKEPGNPFALHHRAWLYQYADNEEAALADAEAYIRAHPEHADAYVLMAELLDAQNRTDLAIVEAGKLTNLFGEDPYALSAAARIYDSVGGQRERALYAIGKAIQLDPDFYYYHFLRAKMRRWSDFAGRQHDLTAALNLAPNDLGALAEMGLLEFAQQHWREAASHFSAVLAKEPKDYGALAYRAMAQLGLGETSQGRKDFDAAMAASSGHDDFNHICRSLATEGVGLDWAIEACGRAIALKTDDSSDYKNRGLAKLRMGRLNDALRDYDRAISLNDRSSGAYFGRALVQSQKGNSAAAEKDRQQALEIDPQVEEAFEEYGVAGLWSPRSH